MEKFNSEKITDTFRASISKITSTEGDILELATLENDEFFSRENEWRPFGFNLGTTVANVAVRSTTPYHLRLSDDWPLDTRGNICFVLAPAYRPTLPVAIDTGSMRNSAANDWARFDKHDEANRLESTITGVLANRAASKERMSAVRENCRRSVGEFVRNRLLREDQWRDDRLTRIVVRFPDEVSGVTRQWMNDASPVIQLRE